MNRALTSLMLMNMLMNLFIIGMVVKFASEGVCLDPVYVVPTILTNEDPQS